MKRIVKFWIIIIFVIIAIGTYVLFFFSYNTIIEGELYKKSDLGPNTIYVSTNNIERPYSRQALNDIFTDQRDYSEVVRIFGAPTYIFCSKSASALEQITGFVIYVLENQSNDTDSKQLFGHGVLITFESGIAIDWDIFDSGITIEPCDSADIEDKLHVGMKIEDVEKILGAPTRIYHDDGEISSYVYVFSGDWGSFQEVPLEKYLAIRFEDGTCYDFSVEISWGSDDYDRLIR